MAESDTLTKPHRSIDPDYIDLIITERYRYWTLLVHEQQEYPGSMIAWLVRPGKMQKLTDLTDDELLELKVVCRDAEFALYHLFRPDHMNYEMLGNLFHLHGGHGHVHILPRYAKPIRYRGRNYSDTKWGRHPLVEKPYKPPREELHALRIDIRHKLPH